MHDALAISDILSSVFKFTDTETDVECVRVCKAWHEPALDALWYRVNKLEQLFKLLGPMRELSPGLQTFLQYHISSERWERFSFYANRVRRLECTETYPTIHHQSFATISISRPILKLLPNLTHLTWKTEPARPTVSLTLCLLFLNPRLKSLAVRTGVSSSQGDLFAIDNFFRDVALRSPRLKHVEFRSDIPFHVMGPVLSNFLTSLPRLKKVKLSDSLLSSDVVTALAKCSDLESVAITNPGSDTTSSSEQESADLENFMPFLEEGAFPSIKAMEFKAHLWNATHFLQSAFPTSRLSILEVRTVRSESHEDVNSFFAAIAAACPTIESLSLDVCRVVGVWNNEPAPFAALEPLLQCRFLAMFTLRAPWLLDLNDAQAATLASHWPRMRVLDLNASSLQSYSGRIHLTLMALSSFAMHCPYLQSLAICVQPLFLSSIEVLPHLPNLEVFEVNISSGDFDSEELALFLAEVTPATCTIVGKAIYPHFSSTNQASYAQYTQSQYGIETTLLLLPMLRKLQRQYREKLRVLEEEVQRLNFKAIDS